ncbi:MAG: DUF924 domain-containing protein [Sedimenticola sp.]|nr:DUF924 domain-containing protein [Sedimenticola sp.]MCW8975334.1 DUF924 domain-containing protein [Sedimenticola sp.]MCW9021976.1 DUF924 domain-containing protein [Sedimenticola sp.]MDF1530282.1 DUF924 domain-containing protein [Sedimenticola sp.]
MAVEPQEILNFWFSEPVCSHWFSSTPELDQQIGDRYLSLWGLASEGHLDHWMTSAEGCLALVILLDQFPLNMFRGQPQSFQTEAQSRSVAGFAIKRGFDKELTERQRAFLYMPYMHSEDLDDQECSVALYEQSGLDDNLAFALHHREIVRQYGRFPHRNPILGRSSSPEELQYLVSDRAFTG